MISMLSVLKLANYVDSTIQRRSCNPP